MNRLTLGVIAIAEVLAACSGASPQVASGGGRGAPDQPPASPAELAGTVEGPITAASEWWTQGGDRIEGDGIRAIAVTPFGAWLQHQPDESTRYGYYPKVLWASQPFSSEQEAEGSFQEAKEYELPGRWSNPIIVKSWTPSTTYYVRIKRARSLSGLIEIRTRDLKALGGVHFALSEKTKIQLQARYRSGEIDVWVNHFRATLRGSHPAHAFPAALLFAITGESGDREVALARWSDALKLKTKAVNTGNYYRWAGAGLAKSTALLWNQLSANDRNRAVLAMLEDDEQEKNLKPPFGDSDQFVANAHIRMFTGFFKDAPGVSPSIRSRLEAVHQAGIRDWEGALKPQLRLHGVRWGMAGGSMPDGTDYATGTATHWLDILWAMSQLGHPDASVYAPWVRNHIRQKVHLVVPGTALRFSYGDIEGGDVENNGTSYSGDWSTDTLLMHMASEYGFHAEANHLRAIAGRYSRPMGRTRTVGGFELLYRESFEGPRRVPTVHVDTGFGVAFARTNWSDDAHAIMVLFGSRGFHHGQPDIGHISWWHDGAWKLHEIPEYKLTSNSHNVPAGQFSRGASVSGYCALVEKNYANSQLSLTLDLTDAYRATYGRKFPYESVRRSVEFALDKGRLQVRDEFTGGEPAQTKWVGDAKVSATRRGNGIDYLVQ